MLAMLAMLALISEFVSGDACLANASSWNSATILDEAACNQVMPQDPQGISSFIK